MSQKEALFSAKNLKLLTDPLNQSNPVTVLVLGVCSALAITVKLEPAVVMGISASLVAGFSSFAISLLRKTIPGRIRIIIQLFIVASLVIVIDQILRAYLYEISKQLSVFIGLIITNCIIMGRIEAFALHNKPWPSFLDGIGTGLGYGLVLVVVAFFRELLGSGTLFGFPVIPKDLYVAEGGFYVNNGLMILPPMALIVLGLIIWGHRVYNKSLIEGKE